MVQANHLPLQSSDQQAIVALCTPRGSGAIGLIRISGPNAVSVAAQIARLTSEQAMAALPTHTIHHGLVVEPVSQEIIDEVLFLIMRAPRTFTGEDTVEITCHNNPFIIERIINAAVYAGARGALPGEFTKRAFLHGKVDLVQAEAINDLIHAQTEFGLKQSMAQLQGTLSQALAHLEVKLIALLGYAEASFEFLDEEQRDIDFATIVEQRTQEVLHDLQGMKQHFDLQKQIRQGIRVALVGSVNAGKSTLFNALVGQERAIVTAIPGTTRDTIELSVYRGGVFWLFVDTAGMRQTDDLVEQQGIERSLAEVKVADVVVIVIDASRAMSDQEKAAYQQLVDLAQQKALLVYNKIDVIEHQPTETMGSWGLPSFHISAKQKNGLELLQVAIQEKIQMLFSQAQSPYLLNQRQFNVLSEIELELEAIAKTFNDGVHYELLAYRLKDLIEKISALTGKNVTENVLDMVFNEFCVGK